MNVTDKQAGWIYFFILPIVTIGSFLSRVFLIACFCILTLISISLSISGE